LGGFLILKDQFIYPPSTPDPLPLLYRSRRSITAPGDYL
jgi:hypothetical protein